MGIDPSGLPATDLISEPSPVIDGSWRRGKPRAVIQMISVTDDATPRTEPCSIEHPCEDLGEPVKPEDRGAIRATSTSPPRPVADRLAEAEELRQQAGELLVRLDTLIDRLRPARPPERRCGG